MSALWTAYLATAPIWAAAEVGLVLACWFEGRGVAAATVGALALWAVAVCAHPGLLVVALGSVAGVTAVAIWSAARADR